jgi:hypothetical protein
MLDAKVDLNRVEGRVRASSLKKTAGAPGS